jgi:hemin uptake protein HemP
MKLRMNRVQDGTERGGDASRKDGPPPRVPLDSILRGRQEIIIQHRDEEYRLRITSNGKLLLTK